MNTTYGKNFSRSGVRVLLLALFLAFTVCPVPGVAKPGDPDSFNSTNKDVRIKNIITTQTLTEELGKFALLVGEVQQCLGKTIEDPSQLMSSYCQPKIDELFQIVSDTPRTTPQDTALKYNTGEEKAAISYLLSIRFEFYSQIAGNLRWLILRIAPSLEKDYAEIDQLHNWWKEVGEKEMLSFYEIELLVIAAKRYSNGDYRLHNSVQSLLKYYAPWMDTSDFLKSCRFVGKGRDIYDMDAHYKKFSGIGTLLSKKATEARKGLEDLESSIKKWKWENMKKQGLADPFSDQVYNIIANYNSSISSFELILDAYESIVKEMESDKGLGSFLKLSPEHAIRLKNMRSLAKSYEYAICDELRSYWDIVRKKENLN